MFQDGKPGDFGQVIGSSGSSIDGSKEKNADQTEILLFRGVGGRTDGGVIGNWWTTNPYYAFRYSNAGAGDMFVVSIEKDDLDKLSTDVSLEDNYQNYFFTEDPPNARAVTGEESALLKSNTTFGGGSPDMPGGGRFMKTPDNAVEIGKIIFGRK